MVLTHQGSSPRDPDKFPTAQLFLLGQSTCLLVHVASVSANHPNSACTGRGTDCDYIHIPVCVEARLALRDR